MKKVEHENFELTEQEMKDYLRTMYVYDPAFMGDSEEIDRLYNSLDD